ncbi:MAG TPA: hypothetical protein VJK51_00930 [Candidatus Nanoarchaeia archaeon]|nr:hypothetical protein [Candidatus Nanoarchaeia archaeon]
MTRAGELKKGDKIRVGEEVLEIEEVEISDISKQGTKKVRIVVKNSKGERITLVRPVDYPVTKVD